MKKLLCILLTLSLALMMVPARPVTVMQPAMRPAIAQATATDTQLFAPAMSASYVVRRATFVVSLRMSPAV